MAKVLDFGISHIRRSVSMMTRDTTILGTPQFMAPEMARARNSELDGRADQFSLAVVLYYAFSGHKPFDSDDLIAVLHQVIYEQPEPLAKLAPQLPVHVVAAIERAMAKSKDDRFPSMIDFVHAVEGTAPVPAAKGPSLLAAASASGARTAAPDRTIQVAEGVSVSSVEIVEEHDLPLSTLDGAPTTADRRPRWLLASGGALLLGSAAIFYAAFLRAPAKPKPETGDQRYLAKSVNDVTPERAVPAPPVDASAARTGPAPVHAQEASQPKSPPLHPESLALKEAPIGKAAPGKRGAGGRHLASASPSDGSAAAAPQPVAPVSVQPSAPAPVPVAPVAPVAVPAAVPALPVAAAAARPTPAEPARPESVEIVPLRSPPVTQVHPEEVKAACEQGDGPKARTLYARLSPTQQDFVHFYCQKQGVYLGARPGIPTPPDPSPAERERARLLKQAKDILESDPRQAGTLASQAIEKYGPSGAAWLLYGMAACKQKNKYESFSAYKQLDVSKRQNLLDYCDEADFPLLPTN